MSFSISSRGVLATIAAAATLAAAPVSAQVITQPAVSPDASFIYQFGDLDLDVPTVPTVGQSFVAAGPFLTSFTFWLSNEASIGTGDNTPNADQLTFQAYLAQWDGTGIVGPVLFTSLVKSGPTSVSQGYTFNTGALAVTSGVSYIAFLTVPDLGDFVGSAAVELSDPTENGGRLFFSLNNDAVALAAGGGAEWIDGNGLQARFQATFSQTATVPEPSTGLLLGSGLAGLIVVARRRRA